MMRQATALTITLITVALGVGPAACQSEPSAGGVTATAEAPAANSSKGKVARVVFVGQRDACDCTRNRIDASWKAVEQALAGSPDIEVQRLELDVDEAKAAEYDSMRSLMVPPGVYLLDQHGKLIDMLQGELKVEQVKGALGS